MAMSHWTAIGCVIAIGCIIRMLHMKKLTFVLAFGALCAVVVCAQIQIPGTAAGRQFSAWLKAQGSGDRATIEQFIGKNMLWGRVQQELQIHNETGGYDIKKVEESIETRIVVLAQEKGPAQRFLRITLNVAAVEPYQIAGIRIQPAQPPPELAPAKMTASQERPRATVRRSNGPRAPRNRTGYSHNSHRPGAGARFGPIRGVHDCSRC